MNHYPQIASRVLNTPLLLEPGYARVFFSALASQLGIQQLADSHGEILTGDKIRMAAKSYNRTRTNKWGEEELIYAVQEGVAILPVSGTLVHKHGYLNPYSGMTGYDGLVRRAQMAFADAGVEGVLLDMDTPGGEVAGCFDASQMLRQMADSAGKPLWALCYDMNASAGMALASAAHRRLITQTGVAGSVGVIMAHASFEKHLEEEGVKVTLIHSGAHKAEGNPYEDLPQDVLERFQNDTHALRTEFARIVAGYTGLSVEAVLATEAATYRGQAAIDVGFADELVNGHDAISIFHEHLSSQGRTISIGATMSEEQSNQALSTEEGGTGGAALSNAGAEEQGAAVGTQVADANARAAERERMQGILEHPEAEGRAGLAKELAYGTDMSVDAAAKLMAAANRGQDEGLDASTALDRLMAAENQPGIGADTGAVGGDDDDMVAQVVGAWGKATGFKPEEAK